MAEVAAGKTFIQGFVRNGWEVVRVCDAHTYFVLAQSFQTEISQSSVPDSLRPVLKLLYRLFCLYHTEAALDDLLAFGYFQPAQAHAVRALVRRLMGELRSQAVALTDALNHSDQYLNSALGVHDGNVYQRLYERARADPMNSETVVSPFDGKAHL